MHHHNETSKLNHDIFILKAFKNLKEKSDAGKEKLKEKDLEIEQLRVLNVKKDDELIDLNELNAKKDLELKGLNELNAKKDLELKGLNELNAKEYVELKGLNELNAKKDAELNEVKNEIKKLKTQFTQLETEVKRNGEKRNDCFKQSNEKHKKPQRSCVYDFPRRIRKKAGYKKME